MSSKPLGRASPAVALLGNAAVRSAHPTVPASAVGRISPRGRNPTYFHRQDGGHRLVWGNHVGLRRKAPNPTYSSGAQCAPYEEGR